MIIKLDKTKNIQLSKHFSSTEFICRCSDCTDNFIDDTLIQKLELVRDSYGDVIVINSGFRCPTRNAAVGGVSSSTHCSGLGVDIRPKLNTLDELDKLYNICEKIFNNIGDGRNKGFIHVDVRPLRSSGIKRKWIY